MTETTITTPAGECVCCGSETEDRIHCPILCDVEPNTQAYGPFLICAEHSRVIEDRPPVVHAVTSFREVA